MGKVGCDIWEEWVGWGQKKNLHRLVNVRVCLLVLCAHERLEALDGFAEGAEGVGAQSRLVLAHDDRLGEREQLLQNKNKKVRYGENVGCGIWEEWVGGVKNRPW